MLALNNLQLVLVDILKANGGWMTTDQIARVLGNDHLSPQVIHTLDWLGDRGLLVKEVRGDDVRYHHR